MPPKRKHSPDATTTPHKRTQISNELEYEEQNDDQSSHFVASSANAWPSLSSYSYSYYAPSLHDDGSSQNSDSTSQIPYRLNPFNVASSTSALAILDLAIDEGTDLPKPLTATRDALQAVLRIVSVDAHNQGWARLTKMLQFHLDTVDNQLAKLGEDEDIDKAALPFDSTLKASLRSYASKLGGIHDLARKRNIDSEDTTGVFEERLRDLDEAFNQYASGLHRFVASVVDQMRDGLSLVDNAFLQKALSMNPSRAETINAYGVQHEQCIRGTRIKSLNSIRQWVDDEDSTNWMFCLLDFAGSGKSTVSKHMDLEWAMESRLMARFFFSRDTAETMGIKRFCSIVANAFASEDETFNTVMERFQKRKDYELLSFEQQFDGLIVVPLKALNRRAILVIDALDECDNERRNRDMLLNVISTRLPLIPHLRVFVTGRPERDIKQWAMTTTGVHCTNFLELEGNHDDVGIYIKERLSHFPSNLQAQVSQVVVYAEGVFIWARIACDLLCKTINKQSLLRSLEKDVTLDHLYTIALEQAIPKDGHSRQAAVMVLEMILALQSPLSIAELVQLSPNLDVVEPVVTSLSSILLYKDREDSIRLIHATLREFLTSRTKAGPWFIQLGPGHYTLARGCIDLLSGVTKEAQGQSSKRQELSGKTKRATNHCLFSVIKYSWTSWGDHCGNSNRKLGLNERIIEFIDTGYRYLLDDSIRTSSDGFVAKMLYLCRVNMVGLFTSVLLK
ncbi:hypothetical protein FRB91_009632 [Serendipita sp. 411]|nr:hypothetical protein FRC19_009316 [Serendipita sp. 401]KAG8849743.1 hypothetical protein FRB91_009632 [Serendipita sp. 411]